MSQATTSRDNWGAAYKAFLFDRKESVILKVAPLVLLAGAPEIIVSNLLPGIGEVIDFGGFTMALIVAVLTYRAVKRHMPR